MSSNNSKTVYNGKFIQVKETEIDGHTWELAYFPDSLVVFPITENNEIIMIEERRPHEKNPVRLKFVTGHVHEDDADVLETANREMMEEIGFRADELVEFMRHESSGTINSTFHYIAARGLSPKKIPNPDGEDTIVAIRKVPLERLKADLYEEKMEWTISTLGFFKVLEAFEKNNLEQFFKNKKFR